MKGFGNGGVPPVAYKSPTSALGRHLAGLEPNNAGGGGGRPVTRSELSAALRLYLTSDGAQGKSPDEVRQRLSEAGYSDEDVQDFMDLATNGSSLTKPIWNGSVWTDPKNKNTFDPKSGLWTSPQGNVLDPDDNQWYNPKTGSAYVQGKWIPTSDPRHPAHSDSVPDKIMGLLKDSGIDMKTGPLKNLSESQIIKMAQDGTISNSDAKDRLVKSGYDAGDAALLLSGKEPKKGLTEGQAIDFYNNGVFSASQVTSTLSKLGYGQGDISNFLANANAQISQSAAKAKEVADRREEAARMQERGRQTTLIGKTEGQDVQGSPQRAQMQRQAAETSFARAGYGGPDARQLADVYAPEVKHDFKVTQGRGPSGGGGGGATAAGFLDSFKNAYATHLSSLLQGGQLAEPAARWAMSNPDAFLTRFLGAVGQGHADQNNPLGYLQNSVGAGEFELAHQGESTARRGTGGNTNTGGLV